MNGLGFGLFLVLLFSASEVVAEPVVPDVVTIPAGPFIMGSAPSEREAAYRLDEAAYSHSRTRIWKWYENEIDRRTIASGAFEITRSPITNSQYGAFVSKTGYPAPDVDAGTWTAYRLVHPYSRTRRHAWTMEVWPKGRADHPVVLVSQDDARAFAAWLSKETGDVWRLPKEKEWEKAARGAEGRQFPWGDDFNAGNLNSHDAGPFDTARVGSYPQGASPFGLLDVAGQVFEWTATAMGRDRFVVKGGSWDDKGCGVCRPAARHSRPRGLKHILIGFRLVREIGR